MKMPTFVRREIKQPINLIASLVTIVNLVYSLQFSPALNDETPSFPVDPLPFRIILLVILEALLGSAFGWAMTRLSLQGKGVPAIGAVAVGLISAWTTFFNIQWILLQRQPRDALDHFVVGMVGVIAFLLAAYFIEVHWADLVDEQRLRLIGSEEWTYFWTKHDKRFDRVVGLDKKQLIWFQLAEFALIFAVIFLTPRWEAIRKVLNQMQS